MIGNLLAAQEQREELISEEKEVMEEGVLRQIQFTVHSIKTSFSHNIVCLIWAN